MTERLSLNGIKAAIFDMDGTMINNMPYHRRAWLKFSKKYGLLLTEKEFLEKFSGKKNKEILEGLFRKSLSQEEAKIYAEEKEQGYRDLYSPVIKEIDGLSDLVRLLKSKGIKIAVATTAPEKNRSLALSKLGFEGTFELVVGDEIVDKGKPDPEIYLTTAEKLHVEPGNCVVFEDSPPGVESAKRARMKVVGVLTTHSKEELNKADLVINTFSELRLTN